MTCIRSVGNFDNLEGQRVLEDMMLDLHKSIAYYLAQENIKGLQDWHLDEFAAAISLWGFLAEQLPKFSPGIKASTVRRWRDLYMPLFDERILYKPNEPNTWRENILAAFARLEAVATLNPPFNWYLEAEE